MSELGEWAKSLFTPAVSGKAEFDKFIQEVNNENAEHLTFQCAMDETDECTATFEQLSKESILEESSKNITVLKSFENILQDRMNSFTSFHTTLSKSRGSFDAFQNCNEQEISESRQQQTLMELKKDTSEVKEAAKKRLAEYHREMAISDKDLVSSEKKLAKSKEHLVKYMASKMPPPSPHQIANSALDGEAPQRLSEGYLAGRKYSNSIGSNPGSSPQTGSTDETIQKYEREISDDSRAVLRTLAYRDQASVASKRAYQKLDRLCKNRMVQTLTALVAKERASLNAKNKLLTQLEESLVALTSKEDENRFISEHRSHDGGQLQGSQALSVLGDLMAEQLRCPWQSESPASLDGQISGGVSLGSGSSSPNGNSIVYDIPNVEMGGGGSSCRTHPVTLTTDHSNTQNCLSRIFYASLPKSDLCSEYVSMIQSPFANMDYRDDVLVKTKQSLIGNTSATDILSWCLKWKKGDVVSVDNLEQENAASGSGSRDWSAWSVKCTLPLVVAVNDLVTAVQEQQGRDHFVTVLNQFRSKKVDVGLSYGWLCAVLWSVLDLCQHGNDVHSAKIIMMLSQTFYITADNIMVDVSEDIGEPPPGSCNRWNESDVKERKDLDRETDNRIYLKEFICKHTIWHDLRFWEQTLWHCVTEQLKDMSFVERYWHDMPRKDRDTTVRRLHDITFSQVMAITHSMTELHCAKVTTREFVYRMCAVHQLGEMNRHMLLSHLHDVT